MNPVNGALRTDVLQAVQAVVGYLFLQMGPTSDSSGSLGFRPGELLQQVNTRLLVNVAYRSPGWAVGADILSRGFLDIASGHYWGFTRRFC